MMRPQEVYLEIMIESMLRISERTNDLVIKEQLDSILEFAVQLSNCSIMLCDNCTGVLSNA